MPARVDPFVRLSGKPDEPPLIIGKPDMELAPPLFQNGEGKEPAGESAGRRVR